MKKILAALALFLGLSAFNPFGANAIGTDCPSSSFAGDRVCIDATTGFGPVVYIYTPGNTLWGTFGVSFNTGWNVGFGCSSGHSSWNGTSTGAEALAFAVAPPAVTQVHVGWDSLLNQAFTSNSTYIAWMQWFGNAASYPTMDFCTAT